MFALRVVRNSESSAAASMAVAYVAPGDGKVPCQYPFDGAFHGMRDGGTVQDEPGGKPASRGTRSRHDTKDRNHPRTTLDVEQRRAHPRHWLRRLPNAARGDRT